MGTRERRSSVGTLLAAGAAVWLLLFTGACKRSERDSMPLPPAEAFRIAQRIAAQKTELSAGYAAWLAIDPASPEGREARQRMELAAAQYRQALALLEAGQPGAREALSRGKALGPMPPALFLPLARACRRQENYFLAQQFYRSYLRAEPAASPPDAEGRDAAARELAELEAELSALNVELKGPDSSPASSPLRLPLLGLVSGLLFSLLIFSALRLRDRYSLRRSLSALSEQNPELQPTLSYLIGMLRHEFLKHRVGAAAALTHALVAEKAALSPERRSFLHQSLYGGTPLREAFLSHVQSFRRALGPDADLLHSDRGFRSAERAIVRLTALEKPLLIGRAAVMARLDAALQELLHFDDALAQLVRKMQHTRIDRRLLTEAAESVCDEYAAGQVALDELLIDVPDTAADAADATTVAMYRTDLLLVLRNLIRNAILAVGRTPAPRRVALDLEQALLPTGEELLRLRIHDTSPAPIPESALSASNEAPLSQRGLALVVTTLRLYGGSLCVGAGRPGYEKCVLVQLFRAQTDEPDANFSTEIRS